MVVGRRLVARSLPFEQDIELRTEQEGHTATPMPAQCDRHRREAAVKEAELSQVGGVVAERHRSDHADPYRQRRTRPDTTLKPGTAQCDAIEGRQ